jgi:DNA polymerase-1
MQFLKINQNTPIKTAILVDSINSDYINTYYVNKYLKDNKEGIIVFDLYTEPKKTKVVLIKEYFNELSTNYLQKLKVENLIVTNGDYFKTLAGVTKIEPYIGYMLKTKCGLYNIIYVPSYKNIFYDKDSILSKIDLCLTKYNEHINNTYTVIGSDIIKSSLYLDNLKDIELELNRLKNYPALTCDIETFGLKHYNSGLGTIAFATDQHNGSVIACDIQLYNETNVRIENTEVKSLLKEFFTNYNGKLIFHNASFDVYILIYQLFMENDLDQVGLLQGLEIMTRNLEDSMILSYCSLNSTVKYSLSLKNLSHEYSGNYSVDNIKDILLVPYFNLLKYNLVDCLSTWYVYNKYYPVMIQDNQLDTYRFFLNTLKDNIQMQLTGLPLDINKVRSVKEELERYKNELLKKIHNNSYISGFNDYIKEQEIIKKNLKLKKKQLTIIDAKESFNLNSSLHLTKLLYSSEFMNLPIIDYTDKKSPATGAKELEKLKNHTTNLEIIDFLTNVCELKTFSKLLETFIPAFLNSYRASDNWNYLVGSYKIGGTVSGRLSSANPNLQNLPSSKDHFSTKLIKECFVPPKGYLFLGADSNSLEDRISALQTKDPEKLKIYTDGFCGHCYRAYYYFKDKINNDIDPSSVDSVNSIKQRYPQLRQDSKKPTFSLTYDGTWLTLMKNCGFTKEVAISIENAFRNLYKHSIAWVNNKLIEASKVGYVTLAFGLRLRTPLLKQVILNNKKTPIEASAEGRTVGNALGQSYCMLNDRAMSEFMNKVRNSKYKYDIKPIAKIHDAVYFLVKNDVNLLKYVNDNLIQAMEWQDDPNISHPTVKLGGELGIFYPHWGKECTIKNNSSIKEIINTFKEHKLKLKQK